MIRFAGWFWSNIPVCCAGPVCRLKKENGGMPVPEKNEACSTNENGCENFICIENAQLLSRTHVFKHVVFWLYFMSRFIGKPFSSQISSSAECIMFDGLSNAGFKCHFSAVISSKIQEACQTVTFL